MISENISLFHMVFLFWIILDSPGNIPLFVSLLKHFDPKRQRIIIWRELIVALIVMILAFFFGQAFFKLLRIDTYALMIAGGIILFIIAVRMIFPKPPSEKEIASPKEPLIVPLAVPAVAGPGIIATIALYSSQPEGNRWLVLIAILISWAASVPVLIFSSYLKQLLGENGLGATERLLGYLVVLISSEMALKGLHLALY